MIEIYVVNYNGRPPATELKAVFGRSGGTLGRSSDNLLALPDPARHVSRVHASIRFDGKQFLISNISDANPLFLNEQEIESGSTHVLAPGDEVRVGLYQLNVRAESVAAVDAAAGGAPDATPVSPVSSVPAPLSGVGAAVLDPLQGLAGAPAGPNPFADLLGPAVLPPDSAAAPAPSPAAIPMPQTSPPRPALTSVPPSADPFADLLGPSALPVSASGSWSGAGASPAKPSFASGIPDDFDPFAMPSNAPRNTDNPLRDLAGSSIDLNAVDANAQRSSMLEFELAKKPDPQDLLQGGTPSLVDPLAAADVLDLFGGAEDGLLNPKADPFGGGMPMRDNVPEVGAHFTPPRSRSETPPALTPKPFPDMRWTAESRDALIPRTATPEPDTASSSGTAPVAEPQRGSTDASDTRPAEPPAAAVPVLKAPVVSPSPSRRSSSAPISSPAVAGTPTASSAEADALLAAFLKGAGVANLSMPNGLTPELMELMGTLVYRATAGAMELIAARQITKREMHAEVTIIVPKDNNPLKFLPTPEAAIMQMLGPNVPGFTATADAMRDAFDDLRAHEVGVIAGVRAALVEVLRRFDPAVLQQRLGKGDFFDALVPNARQAKLWSLYEERFQEIYREAQDDFQALFGEAFIQAYEEQIAQHRAQRKRG